MVSLIAALVLAQDPNLGKVIVRPTGKNGYEEIVQACQILDAGGAGYYIAVEAKPTERANRNNQGEDVAPKSPAHAKIWEELRTKTLLQRRRWAVSRYSKAIELLYKAAEKPIYDPRQHLDYDTLFPELPQIKNLAKMVNVYAYVQMADGNHSQTTNLWATSLDVFERLSHGVLIQYLVGIACNSIFLASIEEHLPRLSATDAKKLETTSQTLLARPPAVAEAIAKDAQYTISSLDSMLKDPAVAEGMFSLEDGSTEAGEALRKMGSLEKARLREAIRLRYGDTARAMLAKLDGPESQWVETDDTIGRLKPDWKTQAGIVDAFTNGLMPVYGQVGVAAARSRTQVRLLGLVASVLKYRWENNRLPTILEDAVGKARIEDPLSRLPFEFRRDGGGGFSVVSKGVKQTGEIALKYRRENAGGAPFPP